MDRETANEFRVGGLHLGQAKNLVSAMDRGADRG